MIAAFIVPKQGHQPSETLRQELYATVRRELGPVAVIGELSFVTQLPKTRSGKIMRRVLKAVALASDPGDISTIEDEGSVDEAREAWRLWQEETATAPVAAPSAAAVLLLGAALVPVLFTYGGWQQTNMIAEEIVDAPRTLPRALLMGVTAVIVVYLLVNISYTRALGVSGLATSSAPAADAMRAALGPLGEKLIAAGIAVSTFGFLNVNLLVTPRLVQASASAASIARARS